MMITRPGEFQERKNKMSYIHWESLVKKVKEFRKIYFNETNSSHSMNVNVADEGNTSCPEFRITQKEQ